MILGSMPLAANAADMVEDYLYLDRMSDMPHHDEQGTRDRPYTLIVRFSPAKLDAALAALGDRPWLAERPKLLVRIMITDKRGSYPLTADGDNDERHRQALLAAAIRYGMHVVLTPLDHSNETRCRMRCWSPARCAGAMRTRVGSGVVAGGWRSGLRDRRNGASRAFHSTMHFAIWCAVRWRLHRGTNRPDRGRDLSVVR